MGKHIKQLLKRNDILSFKTYKDSYLQESSLSRLWRHSQNHDYGTITAFRFAPECGTGTPYTKKENLQRNKSLLAKLRTKGYSVTSIKGSYIENYGTSKAIEVGESSFFVADIQNKGTLKNDLLKLGEEFDQDSVIFGKAKEGGVLIGTNKCPEGYPGYRKSLKQGGALFGKTGEFMSRIKGRPFVFAEEVNIEEYGVIKYPTEIQGPKMLADMDWRDIEV